MSTADAGGMSAAVPMQLSSVSELLQMQRLLGGMARGSPTGTAQPVASGASTQASKWLRAGSAVHPGWQLTTSRKHAWRRRRLAFSFCRLASKPRWPQTSSNSCSVS
eukprot:scaffold58950_cov63-Phaeocystis_antarctica.AAC.3